MGIAKCKCIKGFQGQNCQIPNCDGYNGCKPNGNDFQSKGICEMAGGSKRCKCNKGWSGHHCENIDCLGVTKCGPNGNLYFIKR